MKPGKRTSQSLYRPGNGWPGNGWLGYNTKSIKCGTKGLSNLSALTTGVLQETFEMKLL